MDSYRALSEISIKGFKSIKEANSLDLFDINILLGPNGSGKSSFISFFRMLDAAMDGRLQVWAAEEGSAEKLFHLGLKETKRVSAFLKFGLNGYKIVLSAAADGSLVFNEEKLYFAGYHWGEKWLDLGSGHKEAKLPDIKKKGKYEGTERKIVDYCYNAISSWRIYHFHDTSSRAPIKRLGDAHDDLELRSDGSNLAAYLLSLKTSHPDTYQQIIRIIQLVVPDFDDFHLEPRSTKSGGEQVSLQWRQKNSDYVLLPNQFSDGSIRFIGLVTALMQPTPPSTIIIDEPELGLHPSAIRLLGSLIRTSSKRMQIICSTQSPALVNEFSLENLIIVEKDEGASVFQRVDGDELEKWLEDYTVGQLWEKNLLGGRP